MTDFLERDVEVHERGLSLDGFGVDEKPAIVLLFEQLEIVAIRERRIVHEYDLQLPLYAVTRGDRTVAITIAVRRVAHILLTNIINIDCPIIIALCD